MSEGEGFLSRWSRRKRAAGAAPASPPAAAPAPPEAAAAGSTPPPSSPGAKPPFDPASLPPVESLTAESDFAAFLREEVPAALRRAALRRAWTLDPAIRDFIGPADYAWDYNAPGGVPGFSLDLPGNLERLVAQAIGSGPPAMEERATEEEGAPSPAEAAAPSAEPAPPENPSPEGTPMVEAPADGPVPPEALPASASASAAPIAETPPVRRRHGGALPS